MSCRPGPNYSTDYEQPFEAEKESKDIPFVYARRSAKLMNDKIEALEKEASMLRYACMKMTILSH